MTRADHLAAVAARVRAARRQIVAEERTSREAERTLTAIGQDHAAIPAPRRAKCARSGCGRRVPKGSRARYCSGACQLAAWRARNEPRPVLTLACEAGCGVTFTTRSTVKRFCTDACKRRAFDRRRYWRNARRQEPRGCNRARAMATAGGAA